MVTILRFVMEDNGKHQEVQGGRGLIISPTNSLTRYNQTKWQTKSVFPVNMYI